MRNNKIEFIIKLNNNYIDKEEKMGEYGEHETHSRPSADEFLIKHYENLYNENNKLNEKIKDQNDFIKELELDNENLERNNKNLKDTIKNYILKLMCSSERALTLYRKYTGYNRKISKELFYLAFLTSLIILISPIINYLCYYFYGMIISDVLLMTDCVISFFTIIKCYQLYLIVDTKNNVLLEINKEINKYMKEKNENLLLQLFEN
jgi:hypothetical protein